MTTITPRIRPSPAAVCDVCDGPTAKYRCPRCSQRTCSLNCSRLHKASTGCTGVRDRVAFVAIRDFTDQKLLEDLSLLEEIARVRGCSTRDKKMTRPKFCMNRLVHACQSRHTRLQIMAPGMGRRRRNRSVFDQAKARILWTVEFVFDGERLLRHRIDEELTLGEIIEAIIGDDLALRHRIQYDAASLLLAPSGDSAGYRPVAGEARLREALAAASIIEYPTIHIVRDRDLSRYRIEAQPKEAPVLPSEMARPVSV